MSSITNKVIMECLQCGNINEHVRDGTNCPRCGGYQIAKPQPPRPPQPKIPNGLALKSIVIIADTMDKKPIVIINDKRRNDVDIIVHQDYKNDTVILQATILRSEL